MAKTSFNREILAGQLNLALKERLVALSLTNQDYQGEIQRPGDSVRIVRPSGTTIRSYSNDTDITIDELSATDLSLTVDQSNYFAFYAHDDESIARYVQAFVAEDSYRLAAAADEYVFSQMAASAAAANAVTVEYGGDFVAAIRQARAKLGKQNVSEGGRFVVIGHDDLAAIEEKLTQRETELGDWATVNGFQGMLSGFAVITSGNLPEVADTSRTCIFGTRSGMTYAQAISQIEMLRSENRFADIVRGLHLFGTKAVKPEALGTITISLDDPAA